MIEPLPPVAGEAWLAYNAMETTKHRHFQLLQGLERKYGKHGSANAEERAWLERLLADHDEQVAQFSAAMRELKGRDPVAHMALVNYIAAVNQTLAAYADPGVAD